MRTIALFTIASSVALFAAGCHQPELTRVDMQAENQPPIPAQVSGSGITITEGIGVAVQITPYVDDKGSGDVITVQNGSTCSVQPGTYANEYFIVGGKPGQGTLTITDPSHDGTVTVPVTVLAQAP